MTYKEQIEEHQLKISLLCDFHTVNALYRLSMTYSEIAQVHSKCIILCRSPRCDKGIDIW